MAVPVNGVEAKPRRREQELTVAADRIDWEQIREGFARRFPPEEEKAFVPRKGQTYTYLDARVIEDRLDEVAGAGAWATSYRVIDAARCVVECTLTVHGVGRSDVGYPNGPKDVEPWKCAYTDAIKRAAVQWGIGRYLYVDDRRPEAQSAPAAAESNGNGHQTDYVAELRAVLPDRTKALGVMFAALDAKNLSLRKASDRLDIHKNNTGSLTLTEITEVTEWADGQKAVAKQPEF